MTETKYQGWETELSLPEKETHVGYAYIKEDSDEVIHCSENELIELLQTDDELAFITTPNHPGFILPGTDVFSGEPRRQFKLKELQKDLEDFRSTFFMFVFLFVFFTLTRNSVSSYMGLLVLMFGVFPYLEKLYDLNRVKKAGPDFYHNEAHNDNFHHWLDQKKIKTPYVMLILIGLVFLIQFFMGVLASGELAGLDKVKTKAGEYWRLLSAMFMHVGILHVAINGMVLWFLSTLLIRIATFDVFLIITLWSGMVGNIFSVMLIPEGISMGASGALYGHIGFILYIGLKFKKDLPWKLTEAMIRAVMLTILIGIYGIEILDNAAHLGGFLTGVVLAALLYRNRPLSIPYPSSRWIQVNGTISAGVLLIGIVCLILYLLYVWYSG